jgi:hypothetical protein
LAACASVAAYMVTYINRKQAMQQFGVDVRKHKWTSEQVQERKKGTGMEKWYDEEAVRAVAMAKPVAAVPVAVPPAMVPPPAEIVDVIPALTTEEIGAFKPEVFDAAEVADLPGDYVEVKIAKKAMNYRFVIGTKGEVVRVQDSARVKVGMLLLAKKNARGQFDTKEVVR